MLVLREGCDGAHADAHGANKHEGIVVSPQRAHFCAPDYIGVRVGTERLQLLGYGRARLADGYKGYFLHFSISIGL